MFARIPLLSAMAVGGTHEKLTHAPSRMQNRIGSDIMMQLDDVVSSVADDDARFAEAMDRSVRWLDRCIKVRRGEERSRRPLTPPFFRLGWVRVLTRFGSMNGRETHAHTHTGAPAAAGAEPVWDRAGRARHVPRRAAGGEQQSNRGEEEGEGARQREGRGLPPTWTPHVTSSHHAPCMLPPSLLSPTHPFTDHRTHSGAWRP